MGALILYDHLAAIKQTYLINFNIDVVAMGRRRRWFGVEVVSSAAGGPSGRYITLTSDERFVWRFHTFTH